jgi:hypothetical protein
MYHQARYCNDVTCPGFAWLIRRVFVFDDRIYWAFKQLITAVHKSLSVALSSSSDWTLHRNYSIFQLNCHFKSKLYYDGRSVGQSVLMSSTHLGLMTRFLLLSDSCGFVDVRRSMTRERVCRLKLLPVLASAVTLGSKYSLPYFTVSDSRRPQPGGSGPRIYIPQEQGGPVIPADTGFLFRHLQPLAGLHAGNSSKLQQILSI